MLEISMRQSLRLYVKDESQYPFFENIQKAKNPEIALHLSCVQLHSRNVRAKSQFQHDISHVMFYGQI
jgi:hypothetical protein